MFILPDGVPENEEWPDKCVWRHARRRLNFSWLDADVAGCECPKLDGDFRFLKDQGISGIAGIWELGKSRAPDERKVRRNEIGLFLREPIEDYTAPSLEKLTTILNFMDQAIGQGHKIAVACGFGEGRTGTVLTCYLVRNGLTPSQALRTMLQKERVPYENREQRDRILSYRHDGPNIH